MQIGSAGGHKETAQIEMMDRRNDSLQVCIILAKVMGHTVRLMEFKSSSHIPGHMCINLAQIPADSICEKMAQAKKFR